MNAAQQRKAQRSVHLITGLTLIVYVYAPLPLHMERLVQLLFLPVLVATGIATWQAPRIRRLMRRARSNGAPPRNDRRNQALPVRRLADEEAQR